MKKLLLFLFTLMAICSAQAQYDTIGKYPYLYHYNWPETGIIHDSMYCCIEMGNQGTIYYGNTDYFDTFLTVGTIPKVFALYQHTDTPLEIIGLATGWGTGWQHISVKTTLFDSSLNELSSVHGIYYTTTYQTDADAHHFLFPGLLGGLVFNGDGTSDYLDTNIVGNPQNYIYYKFFKESITVVGDYYIGFSNDSIQGLNIFGSFIGEHHDEPYSFNSGYRIQLTDERWSEMCWRPYVPVLFAIIKLPCEAVDSVSATVGSDGCLQVDWERPALQSSWTVRLVMPDGSAIVQPTDTNHWEYCGLAPNQHYTVYVRSRCDDIDGNSWSDWSEGFSAGSTLAISDIESQDIKLSPNPATDEVSIDSPVPMTLVEAYDEKGACILRQELNTQHSSLNTKGWSSGAYVLRIHTQQGVATKRLTVMR